MNWVSELFGAAQLERIEDAIKRMEQKMSEQEQALDAALAAQAQSISDLKTAADALFAAIPPGIDLSDEIASVQAASSAIGDVTSDATGATPGEPPA